MRVMRFDQDKLRRLIDAADEARAALMSVSDRRNEARNRRNQLKLAVDRDIQQHGRTTRENILTLEDASEEYARLDTRYERLQENWNNRNAIAAACREWAENNGGLARNRSVLSVGGAR